MTSYHSAGPFPQGLDIVFLEGLTIKTKIGIEEHELRDPQPIRINIAIGTTNNRASQTDQIIDTIDYGAVRSAVKLLAEPHRCKLVEIFAEQIAQLILNDFNADWVRVWVAKAAVRENVEARGIVIERTRNKEIMKNSRDDNLDH